MGSSCHNEKYRGGREGEEEGRQKYIQFTVKVSSLTLLSSSLLIPLRKNVDSYRKEERREGVI